MSEILDGCGRFDDVYRKAYWAKTSLDCTTDVFDEETAISDCISYFKERRKNTTVGDIAYAEVVRKNPLGETEYTKNLRSLSRHPEVDSFFKESRAFNAKNYPKTGLIRNRLIRNFRFRLYEVLPKLTGFSKFAMKYLK